jgi:hypothetical protein
MDSSERGQPLHYSLEVLANLIYLARRCESEQQHQYMERAENLLEELRHNLTRDEAPRT